MKTLCLVFFTHQPILLKKYRFYEIGTNNTYFSDSQNYENIRKLVRKKYKPLKQLISKAFQEHGSQFKVSFSFSGVTVDLLEYAAPEVINDLKELNETGPIEFLSETYSNSLLSKKCKHEFMQQTMKQRDKILQLFGQLPKAFMNNYGYSAKFLAHTLPQMGLKLLLQFQDTPAKYQSNTLFSHKLNEKEAIKILSSSKRMLQPFIIDSNKIDTDAFLNWVISSPEEIELFCLAMDYKEMTTTNQQDLKILEFIEELPSKAIKMDIQFCTPSELMDKVQGNRDMNYPINLETLQEIESPIPNKLQTEILMILDGLKDKVYQTRNENIIKTWFYLQDQRLIHPLSTMNSEMNLAVQHYINFRNILQDFTLKVEKILTQKPSELTNRFKSPLGALDLSQVDSEHSIFNTLF